MSERAVESTEPAGDTATAGGAALRDDPAVGLARANLYRYLSAAVQAPAEPGFRRLADEGFRGAGRGAAAWLGRDPAFRPAEIGPGEIVPGARHEELPFPDPGRATEEYVRAFGHSISKDCPPYEGEYFPNRDVTFRSQQLADVAGFYRAFGLDRHTEAKERIDHLAFQAEFMEVVIARQLFARVNDLGSDPVAACRTAQREFFVDHLGWWLPAFGSALEERCPEGFYGGLGRWIREFVAVERAVLGVPPFTDLPAAEPQEWESLDGCGTCPGPADRNDRIEIRRPGG